MLGVDFDVHEPPGAGRAPRGAGAARLSRHAIGSATARRRRLGRRWVRTFAAGTSVISTTRGGVKVTFVVPLVAKRRLGPGRSSKWGVLRYARVTSKLLLNVSVIVVGAFLIGPATGAMVDGRDGSEAVLILASACDVVALVLATGLSVFKPGGLWR